MILLNDTSNQMNVKGLNIPAAGYFNRSGTHTAVFYLNNFIGKILIEGTIANNPQDQDFFLIKELDYTQFTATEVTQEIAPETNWFEVYLVPLDITQIQTTVYSGGGNGTVYTTFNGNFTYVRARIDRTYMNPQPVVQSTGSIQKALLSF